LQIRHGRVKPGHDDKPTNDPNAIALPAWRLPLWIWHDRYTVTEVGLGKHDEYRVDEYQVRGERQ
jgi:hypothetical protein